MTTLRFTRRGATLLVAGLLAGAAMVPFAGPAMADPTPAPTSGPSVPGGTPTSPNAGAITWSVQPSTANGPDKRSSFIYNMQRSEILRISNSRSEVHVQLDPATDLDEFFALFEKITGRRLTSKSCKTLEDEFHAFRTQFAASAHLS